MADLDDAVATPPLPKLTEDVFTRPDHTLQRLAHFADFFGSGVTLYLPWGVAVGRVVGGAEFFDSVAKQVRSIPADDPEWTGVFESYAAAFEQDGEMAKIQLTDSPETEERPASLDRGFIHLRDVQCYTPGAMRYVAHEYLRIKLNHITGWAFGQMRL